jgi:hypothetical protein
MATETNFKDVFEKNKYNLSNAARKSQAWFQQQTLLLQKQRISPGQLIRGNDLTSNILPGNMYMFSYDAKHKDTLPYWDRFPLLLPYKKYAGGFIGLNMHYLPYQMRFQLMDRLMYFANNKAMDDTTKLRYSWGLIDGISKYKAAEICIKQYLTEHVRSPFRKISPEDWATALMLPVESFVGSNKYNVWQESKRAFNK